LWRALTSRFLPLPSRSDIDVASLRTQAQVDFAVSRFPEYKGKVTGAVIPDITVPGAYDQVVRDVDAIIHLASPVVWTWNDPSEIVDPSVKGATGILASAVKFGGSVKRVVLTSSGVTISAEAKEGEVYEEVSVGDSLDNHC
jgi:nucleoside-diphosphate-sugar epimerase